LEEKGKENQSLKLFLFFTTIEKKAFYNFFEDFAREQKEREKNVWIR
jgi:hypothetical protein